MVRDQANKTLDVYLLRVRKYAQTIPDTLPSAAEITGASSMNAPRMGTPQTDTSWAGWAISSFTKQLGAASGQMQSDTTANLPAEQRSNSAPLSSAGTTQSKHPTGPVSSLASVSAKPNPFAAAPTTLSTSETADEPAEAWDDGYDAWGEPDGDDIDPFAPRPSETLSTSAATFDDKGEPDFAGWLNAQAQTKKSIKKPLPKGLSKPGQKTPSARPVLGKAASTGSTAVKKPTKSIAAIAPKPNAKKEETKLEEEGDDWGDAWD
jgi:SCY1-like protein 1